MTLKPLQDRVVAKKETPAEKTASKKNLATPPSNPSVQMSKTSK